MQCNKSHADIKAAGRHIRVPTVQCQSLKGSIVNSLTKSGYNTACTWLGGFLSSIYSLSFLCLERMLFDPSYLPARPWMLHLLIWYYFLHRQMKGFTTDDSDCLLNSWVFFQAFFTLCLFACLRVQLQLSYTNSSAKGTNQNTGIQTTLDWQPHATAESP